MHTGLSRHRKAAADLEIDTDIELPLAGIEVHPGDEPGTADAEDRLEDLISDHCDLSVCCEPKSHRSKGRIVPPRRGCPHGSTGARYARPTAWPGRLQPPGCRTVDYEGNRATSGRITHSKLDRAKFPVSAECELDVRTQHRITVCAGSSALLVHIGFGISVIGRGAFADGLLKRGGATMRALHASIWQ